MRYHSEKNPSITATFSEALLANLAADGGLWMPDRLPHFSSYELKELAALSFPELAARLAGAFVDDHFSAADIQAVCADAYNFDLPITGLNGADLGEGDRDYVFELTHGPTLAFKDFAARFMARFASLLLSKLRKRRTILVATSGDTGGAVGAAFAGQPGVDVFILYPKNGVSRIQEAQLTTVGAREGNVHALAVNGSFDDCQSLVKHAFADEGMAASHELMSANSINVGRVVPQSFYYFWAALRVQSVYGDQPLTIAVPSGNLGNVTGGLIARAMGAPITCFVVGHNRNDPFVEYLTTGNYRPRASVPTLSNAMDIGRPNNFDRILALFDGNIEAVREACWGASFSDPETEQWLRAVWRETGYVMCPHTAIGYAAAQEYRDRIDDAGVFLTLATAHPAKFADDVERIIERPIGMPLALSEALRAQGCNQVIEPSLPALRAALEAAS